MERVLVSLVAAFLPQQGRGRRWRDVEGVGTGEGRDKAEWKRRLRNEERGKREEGSR